MVSLVIPAFNAAEFLEEGVGSGLAQGDVVGEIVIVNDGSTDDTGDIGQRLARRHDKVRYQEHRENRGGGATRNSAVRLARGDYLFNLDADNVLPRNLVSQLLDRANEHERHTLITPARLQFFRDVPRKLGFGTRRVLTHAWDYDRLDQEHILTHPNTPASSGNYLFHRAIFDAVGGYFETHGPYDAWSFGLRCALAGFPFVAVPETLYLHRVTGVSYWQRNQDSGANREYLFRALSDLGCYEASTLRDLDPERLDYPDDPFGCLRLRAGGEPLLRPN